MQAPTQPAISGRTRVERSQPKASGADAENSNNTVAFDLRFNILLILASMLVFAALSVFSGKDVDWDLLNYHYYNGFAAATDAWEHNYFPAQLQSYYVPTLDYISYLLIKYLPPVWVGIVIGSFQGLNFWLVFRIAATVIRARMQWLQWVLWFGCAIVAMHSPTSVIELGNTMGDLIVVVPILAGILLLLTLYVPREVSTRDATWLLFAAGLVFGIALGMKLTIVIFVVAAAVAFLVTLNRESLRRILVFMAGTTVTLLLTAGYWFIDMAAKFGSPVFPLYNALFKSPYEVSTDFMDTRFLPQTKIEWLFQPFYFTFGSSYRIQEIPFQNLTFAAIYVLLALLVITLTVRVLTRARATVEPSVSSDLRSAQIRLVIFFVLGYVLWEKLFSIYRYMSSLELLAPIVALLIIEWIVSIESIRGFASLSLLVVLGLTMQTENWGRYPWGTQYFAETVPSITHPNDAVVIMTSYDPTAYLIPAFPRGVHFVRVQSNYDALATPLLISKEDASISADINNAYVLTTQTSTSVTNDVLRPYGLQIVPNACQTIAPNIAQPPNAPAGISAAYFCRLQPSSLTHSG